jgi:hypothetical protein
LSGRNRVNAGRRFDGTGGIGYLSGMAGTRPRPHPAAPRSRAVPPLYLLRAGACCPHCGEANNVYALAASGLYDAREEDDLFEGLFLLTYVEDLPARWRRPLMARCPRWRFDREGDGRPYLMNHCRRCGAQLPDRDIHGHPGTAFAPGSPDECWNITRFALPGDEEIRLICSWSTGLADMLDAIKAAPW